ncbi:MAG: hypothetical protein SCABRO_03432 [Candidatus Scalindua brodae]|uniref:Uncharacterized protein n=1 Tax=Candidatus Scalindua brodae TaxID=237368 RepID=A0A0B0EFH1_9BACT|nr:MAG: hypothetical protein SCABRO_03432 [Candidatus Scalindua brodae]
MLCTAHATLRERFYLSLLNQSKYKAYNVTIVSGESL